MYVVLPPIRQWAFATDGTGFQNALRWNNQSSCERLFADPECIPNHQTGWVMHFIPGAETEHLDQIVMNATNVRCNVSLENGRISERPVCIQEKKNSQCMTSFTVEVALFRAKAIPPPPWARSSKTRKLFCHLPFRSCRSSRPVYISDQVIANTTCANGS